MLAITFTCQSCVTTDTANLTSTATAMRIATATPPPTKADMAAYNYGSMSDSKALQLLKSWGISQFKDPYSVKYQITKSPKQGWAKIPTWNFRDENYTYKLDGYLEPLLTQKFIRCIHWNSREYLCYIWWRSNKINFLV